MSKILSANYLSALRKPGMLIRGFTMFPAGSDLSWIDRWTDSIGSGPPVPLDLSGAINGTDGTDGNAVFTIVGTSSPILEVVLLRNSAVMDPNFAFSWDGLVTVTYLSPYIPVVRDGVPDTHRVLAWI